IERRFDVSDTDLADVQFRIPVERHVDDRHVDAIRSVNGIQNGRAIFDTATQRAELIETPRQSHRAVATHASKSRTHAGGPAASRWLDARASGFAADRKAHPAGRGCRSGTRRRSAGSLFEVPGVLRLPTEPVVAAGQFTGSKLSDEHSARRLEPFHDGRIV